MSQFDEEKKRLLGQLNKGIDYSPKGSIDKPILNLVQFLNELDNYFTTSSCSGRISIHVSNSDDLKGVEWLFVEHGVISAKIVRESLLKLQHKSYSELPLVMFKCEPLILHVQCRDIASGQKLQQIVYNSGMRESGLNIGKKKIMLAIRTTSNMMDFPIAQGEKLLISDHHLDIIIEESNSKLLRNFMKIDKILFELKKEFKWPIFTLRKILSSTQENSINRWGHSLLEIAFEHSKLSKYIILGGYGIESNGHNVNKSGSRDISILSYDPEFMTGKNINIKENENNFNEHLFLQHSAVINCNLKGNNDVQFELLIVSGGRRSPEEPSSILQMYSIDLKNNNKFNNDDMEIQRIIPLKFKYDDISAVSAVTSPCPRWGHTLAKLNNNSFLLYGGRDNDQVFDDCYLLNVNIDEKNDNTNNYTEENYMPELICNWTKLNLKMSKSDSAIPVSRFFHVAVAIDWYTDIHCHSTNK